MRTLHPALALAAFITLPMALADDRPTPKGAEQIARQQFPEPERVTRVVKLSHADARNMTNEVLRAFSVGPTPPGGPLMVVDDLATNSLVLSAAADVIAKAEKVIEQLDAAPLTVRQTKIIRLQHAPAKDLASLLRETMSHRMPGMVSEQPGVTFDERTGTLVLTGEAAGLKALETLIESLDVKSNAPGEIAQTTQARVSVYQVAMPLDAMTKLNANELRTMVDEQALSSQLEKLGTTKLLYVLEQPVDLEKHPAMKIGTENPMPVGTARGKDGQGATSVGYQNMGCIVNMEGRWPSQTGNTGTANIEVEIAHATDSNIEISPNVKASAFHKVKQQFSGPVESGRPIILLSLEAGAANDSTVAYITRIELKRSNGEAKRA